MKTSTNPYKKHEKNFLKTYNLVMDIPFFILNNVLEFLSFIKKHFICKFDNLKKKKDDDTEIFVHHLLLVLLVQYDNAGVCGKL